MINIMETFKESLIMAMEEGTADKSPPQIITYDQAREYNDKKFGIFFTVQGFKERRIKENLTRINAWAVDIDADAGTKEEIRMRVEQSPLTPSLVVETKNGYHVYWLAKDARPEDYRPLLEKCLIPFFGADKNAKDLSRTLRYPGFMHWKDRDDPFPVEIVHEEDVEYSQAEMLFFFSKALGGTDRTRKNYSVKDLEIMCGGFDVCYPGKWEGKKGSFWANANEVNCKLALERLSGSRYVDGEHYEFALRSSGGYTIIVNGKPSAAWLDKNGMIGSSSGGGPTIVNWLLWYKNTPREIAEIMKGVFNVRE